jgi:hypothetical protein
MCPENMPKPPPVIITGIKINPLLVQLLEQITEQQYEITDDQIKVQPKMSGWYETTVKVLAKKCMDLHAYKLKEE